MASDLRVAEVAEDTEARPSSKPATRLAFRFFLVAVAAALVPVAVATTRAIHDGWVPTEDNALVESRAWDLFSYTDLPLIGTASSASLTADTNLNHPGPLYSDLLAAPVRLIDSGAGTAFGVALINSLCIAGIALFAYRRGGAVAGTAAIAVTAALCWTMGSRVLFEPWNPHSVLLPFLFFLVLVWSMACGDLVALPLAAVAGSLVVQTHLSYSLLVPVLGAWGIVGMVLSLRRDRRDTSGWPARRRRAWFFAAGAGAALAVCWLQPLIEQFTSEGRGNLSRLIDSARSPSDTIGYSFGARVVATVVSLPPWWLRPSMDEAFIPGWRAPSSAVAVLSLAVLAVVLAWCAWNARRREDRTSWWAVGTAVVALLTALLTAGRGPITVFGKVTTHTFRWLWPLGAFVFFAVLLSLARRLAHRTFAPTSVAGVLALATIGVAALNVPSADQGRGPNSLEFAYAQPAVRDLNEHMGPLEGQGPLLIDDLFRGAFADPYGGAVVVELQRRGIPFVTDDPVLVRQYGPARRYDGHNAKAALLLRQGEATLEPPPESRPIARGQGLPPGDVRELGRLKERIAEYIGRRGLSLNARGERALAAGKLPVLARSREGQALDVDALFASRELDIMIQARYLVLDQAWAKRFARYTDLQRQWDEKTVALFLAPVSSSTRPSSS